MKIPFIPSLENLCCTKIVPLLFEKELPYIEGACLRTSRLLKDDSLAFSMSSDMAYNVIYKHISENIKILTPCAPLQKKLQSFIAPLFCEITDWLHFCESIVSYDNYALFVILKNIPRCWASNGSIDREKSAKIVVKNSEIGPTYRFLLACSFCLLDDVLDTWKLLPIFAYFLFEHHPDVIPWIGFLQSIPNKDFKSFIEWAVEKKMGNKNVYVMKHIFKTINFSEQNQYLLSALTEKDVNHDIMCFGLSQIARDELEIVFKKNPVEVFKCVTSWPMRSNFYDILPILMPSLTCDAFMNILNMLLLQIKLQKKDCDELIIILKMFWRESPSLFKNSAYNKKRLSEPLQIILQYNFTDAFPLFEYLYSFDDDLWSLTPFII